jgi:hypothetical protein
MKSHGLLSLLGGLALFAGTATTHAQDELAPATLANVVFNGVVTGSTGNAFGAGTFTLVFAADGMDYTLATAGEPLRDPVRFVYERTGDDTAEVSEPATDSTDAVVIGMTFTSATEGTFTATYDRTPAATQTGTFVLAAIPNPAPLVNMSTRLRITAGGVAFPGFVIGGNVPRRVLLRAVGPELATYGVTLPIADPMVSVWKGSERIAMNDDWSDLEELFEQVGAFPLPEGSKDAAIVVTLEPGAYTAMVEGASAADAGEVLVETYFVD